MEKTYIDALFTKKKKVHVNLCINQHEKEVALMHNYIMWHFLGNYVKWEKSQARLYRVQQSGSGSKIAINSYIIFLSVTYKSLKTDLQSAVRLLVNSICFCWNSFLKVLNSGNHEKLHYHNSEKKHITNQRNKHCERCNSQSPYVFKLLKYIYAYFAINVKKKLCT